MLKGIAPLLSADLLWILAAMGHGDDLAIVDGNHPAEAIARATTSGRLVCLPRLRVYGLILNRTAWKGTCLAASCAPFEHDLDRSGSITAR